MKLTEITLNVTVSLQYNDSKQQPNGEIFLV